MKRDVAYTWRLAELMAAHGMHNSTDLVPPIRERGIDLSASQIYRLVTSKPERVSLKLIAAICDVFSCGPEDLITVTAADARKKPIAAAAGASVVDIDKSARPKRARVIRDDD
jgi:DNA-binding Xre family transcriptional regulator